MCQTAPKKHLSNQWENTAIFGRPLRPTLVSALYHFESSTSSLIFNYCAQKHSNSCFDLYVVTHIVDDSTDTLLNIYVVTKYDLPKLLEYSNLHLVYL
jgi:hypothetical protein